VLVGDLLRDSASRAPEQVALIGRGQRLTYAQFDAESNRLANALLGLRLRKSAKVAILCRNCPQYAITYFAIARTCYVSAHCSTRSSADELAYVLNKMEVEVLFLDSCFASLVAEVLPKLERTIRLIMIGQPDEPEYPCKGATAMEEFVKDQPVDAPEESPDEVDPLAITLTGGTTGLPKGVLVSHRARCASAVAAAREFGLDETDIVAASTPLFHTAGLFVWFGTAVLQGTTIVFPESWDPVEFMLLVEQEKVTAAFLVPSQLNDLVAHPAFSSVALHTLRNIGYAGAPMARALAERIRAALPNVMFTENYGQSEACPITIRCEEHGLNKRETVGRAASNAEVGIVDKQGQLLSPGEIGDIVTRGDQVFDGYFNDPKETDDAFRLGDGWLLTGDVGFLDSEGFLTLVDRSKDMLVSGGENVYPVEIENALYQHEAIFECAVFGIPDERWGEVPAAHVVLVSGAVVSEEELIRFCVSRIARFKRPRVVRFMDELPKTTVGKIRKNALREPYWEGHEKKI